MKFVLIRHCETASNQEHRYQGLIDTTLNKRGKLQAVALAEELSVSHPGVSLVLSSDLKRALQTAEIVAGRFGAPLVLDRRLRECNHGAFDGLTRTEVIKKYGAEVFKNVFTPEYARYDFGPYGGENRESVIHRHLGLLNELIQDYPKEKILLVGHGRGLNTLLAELGYETGLQREEFRVIDYPR